MSTSRLRIWVAAACLALASGCVKTTVETFRSVPDARSDMAYVKAGVDFARYTRLQPVPLEIYYYEGLTSPDPSDVETVRRIFREAFLAKLGDDYTLVEEPGPGVLFVRASLVDLELSSVPDDLPVKGRAASLVAAGQLTFFMELADSESGEVLARAGDKEEAPAQIAGAATERDWTRTEQAAERWAQMFRDFLDENLGHETD